MVTFINLNKEKKNKLTFDHSGQYVVFFHNLSGKFIFELTKSDINVEIYGIYTGQKKDDFQLETIQLHQAPRSTSNILIKGVFRDQAVFNYLGLIRVENTASKSVAYQKNQNLVLSSDVFVESKPFLEILNNDVYCTHGVSTGGVDKNEIFYLKTRGLSEKDAEKLLIKGFIQEIFDKLEKHPGLANGGTPLLSRGELFSSLQEEYPQGEVF